MAALSTLAALAVFALAVLVQSTEAYNTGDATAYSDAYEKDKTGKNSCQLGQLPDRWERYYCAIPSFMFKRSEHCGRCIKARGIERGASGEWVKCMVVDECGDCPGKYDVDMSIPALKATTGFSWDRKRIEWEWTDCDDDAETSSSSNSNDDEDSEREARRQRRKQEMEEAERAAAEEAERAAAEEAERAAAEAEEDDVTDITETDDEPVAKDEVEAMEGSTDDEETATDDAEESNDDDENNSDNDDDDDEEEEVAEGEEEAAEEEEEENEEEEEGGLNKRAMADSTEETLRALLRPNRRLLMH